MLLKNDLCCRLFCLYSRDINLHAYNDSVVGLNDWTRKAKLASFSLYTLHVKSNTWVKNCDFTVSQHLISESVNVEWGVFFKLSYATQPWIHLQQNFNKSFVVKLLQPYCISSFRISSPSNPFIIDDKAFTALTQTSTVSMTFLTTVVVS
jgi:hypothetical protein